MHTLAEVDRRRILIAAGAALGGSALLAYRWAFPLGNLSIGRILLAVLLILLLNHIPRLVPSRRSLTVVVSMTIFLAVHLIGLLYSSRFAVGLREVIQLCECFLLFWAIYATGRLASFGGQTSLAKLPYIGFAPTGLIACIQGLQIGLGERPTIPLIHLARLETTDLEVARVAFSGLANSLGIQRIAAATGDPPTFGVLCAFVVVYDLWLRRAHANLVPAVWSKLSVTVALLGVVMSTSITAILVLLVGILASIWGTRSIQPREDRPFTVLRWLTGIVIIGVPLISILSISVSRVGLFWTALLSRITSIFSDGLGAEGHQNLMRGAWGIFGNHPIYGVGSGAGSSVYRGTPQDFSSFHSVFALAAVELGSLGLIALLLFMGIWMRAYLPVALVAPLLVAWGIYLDLDRMPFLWGLAAIVAVLHTKSSNPTVRRAHAHPRGRTGRDSPEPSQRSRMR